MRHRIRKAKLGRTTEHRKRMLNNLVCSLIKHRRVKTTLAKAKAARVVADKMITIGKKGQEETVGVHYRRLMASRLQQDRKRFFPKKNGVSGKAQRAYWRQNEDVVRILFDEIAPGFEGRNGGYTRVIKLGRRQGDAAEMAILEWVSENDTPITEDNSEKVKKSKPAGSVNKDEHKAKTDEAGTAEESEETTEPESEEEEASPEKDETSEESEEVQESADAGPEETDSQEPANDEESMAEDEKKSE